MKEPKIIKPERELRVKITYSQKDIDGHLLELRRELAAMKEVTEPGPFSGTVKVRSRVTGILGAIHMLEDMKRRGGVLEVWNEPPRAMTEQEAVKVSESQI